LRNKLQKKYDYLVTLGFTPSKISICADLLAYSISTIKNHYLNLRNIGYPKKQIENNPEILQLTLDNVNLKLQFLKILKT